MLNKRQIADVLPSSLLQTIGKSFYLFTFAHPKEISLTTIQLEFFSSNAMSEFQLFDQDVIKILKQDYREKLVQQYL